MVVDYDLDTSQQEYVFVWAFDQGIDESMAALHLLVNLWQINSLNFGGLARLILLK